MYAKHPEIAKKWQAESGNAPGVGKKPQKPKSPWLDMKTTEKK